MDSSAVIATSLEGSGLGNFLNRKGGFWSTNFLRATTELGIFDFLDRELEIDAV